MMKKLAANNLLIRGKGIILRRIWPSDANRKYLKWMQDPKINQYLESRFEAWSIKKIKSGIQNINSGRDYLFLAIVTPSGCHIGNIKVGPINRRHKFADMGIIIGEKDFRGKGLATEAIKLTSEYCFKKLGLHKLNAGVYRNNIGSIKAFKRSGFKIEGIKRSQYLYRGSYIDAVMLGMVKQ